MSVPSERFQTQPSKPPRQSDLGPGSKPSLPPRHPDSNLRMKDYSKDPNVHGWQERGMDDMSSVALQAQGYSLPPRQGAPPQKYPYGVSITQDPQFMNLKMDAHQTNKRSGSIREVRDRGSNIYGQNRVETQFQKPMAERNPNNFDQLYFQGKSQSAGQRHHNSRHHSSIDGILSGAQPLNGQNPPRTGKRQITHTGSTSNLVLGGYGGDVFNKVEQNIKPYSKI